MNRKPTFSNPDIVKFNSKLREKLLKIGLITETDKVNKENFDAKLEEYLINEVNANNPEAFFQLGQLYFYNEKYEDCLHYFQIAVERFKDFQCMFQIGVQYYDGLGCVVDPELGCMYMKRIVDGQNEQDISHLVFNAAYNLGRAYYEGFGVPQSDDNAENFWLIAADDGNPLASVPAQSVLGFFYSTKAHLDLEKAFFWHSEACGNGSIESQACLGVMYLYGIGVPVDWEASLICLANAADRGSIYASGNLCHYFYRRKLFTKAAALSAKISQVTDDELQEMSNQSSIIIYEFLCKGVSIACFIFGRCLQLGLGVQQGCSLSVEYFKKSFEWDSSICADFQQMVNRNEI